MDFKRNEWVTSYDVREATPERLNPLTAIRLAVVADELDEVQEEKTVALMEEIGNLDSMEMFAALVEMVRARLQ